MKTKFVIFGIVSLLILIVGYQSNRLNYLKTENDRIENNFYNINQELTRVKDKNSRYHYTIETLTLTKKELEKTKSNLVQQVKDMNLKLKRLESITNVELQYIVKDSIIYVSKENDTTFISGKKNNWIENTWKTTLSNNGKDIQITDYQLIVKDSILTPVEIQYKGWWIFKKPKGVKIHVKSMNPYSSIDKIEYIRLSK